MKTTNLLLIGAALVATISACSPPQQAATTGTLILNDTLSKLTAQRLVNNFNGRANHIKKDTGLTPDARCVWFSEKQLRAMLDNIHAEGGDGVRFYFAAYDKTKMPDLPKINPAYYDYSTLVMVSTRPVGVNHFDYYTNTKGGLLTTVPENTGELCPPPEKCDNVGATLLGDSLTVKK